MRSFLNKIQHSIYKHDLRKFALFYLLVLKKRRSQDNLADAFITKQKRRLQKMADDLKKALEKMNVK